MKWKILYKLMWSISLFGIQNHCKTRQSQGLEAAVKSASQEAMPASLEQCAQWEDKTKFASCLYQLSLKKTGVRVKWAENGESCEASPGGFTLNRNVKPSENPFCALDENLLEAETIKKVRALFSHFKAEDNLKETQPTEKKVAIDSFLDSVVNTTEMEMVRKWLQGKREASSYQVELSNPEKYKEFVRYLWFTTAFQGASSAFEHVFVGEINSRRKIVSGYHNWIKLWDDLSRNKVKIKNFNVEKSNEHFLMLEFLWQPPESSLLYRKPLGTIALGTYPETEMALFTLAFVTNGLDFSTNGENQPLYTVRVYTAQPDNKSNLGKEFPILRTAYPVPVKE